MWVVVFKGSIAYVNNKQHNKIDKFKNWKKNMAKTEMYPFLQRNVIFLKYLYCIFSLLMSHFHCSKQMVPLIMLRFL